MSDTIPSEDKPIDEQIMRMSLDSYRTREQRVAMRGALSDAAHLCDAIAKQIMGPHVSRESRRAIAKRCGDAIWAMRKKIEVPNE